MSIFFSSLEHTNPLKKKGVEAQAEIVVQLFRLFGEVSDALQLTKSNFVYTQHAQVFV